MSKVWLITGASTGFGRALATAAAKRGDTVVATARDIASVADFTHHDRLDVTDDDQVREVVARTVREHGRIDVVVNNAGHGLLGVTEEVTDDELRALLETNLLGAWRVTRAALPHLRQQRGGHIVQLSSVGGVVGNPGHAAYATSKFALEGMSEALAGEIAGFGIHVTIVEPGPFRTDFAGRSIHTTEPNPAYSGTPGGDLRARFSQQDGRQPNDPDKAAAAIIAVVDAPEPPLRLPLGPEAVTRIRAKLRDQLTAIDEWEALALDTRAQ
ncbi:oxidoreductase [Nocardia sp. NPDC052254]|uniref:oxidoreductase n=1 Tax=Nocardia sp. NPDC052254 TaxID=3155681 RepID=UPI00343A4CEE